MPDRARLDSELVRRGLARSRRHADELIGAGRVRVDGAVATKSATALSPEQAVQIEADGTGTEYASRAGHKLAGVLDALGPHAPVVRGRRCLDAGASTGGFTDVLLRRGAVHVVAVDVGHDQLLPRLRDDPRVTVREGVNVRYLEPADVRPSPDLVVADLSFISLTLVLPALSSVVAAGGDLLLMVKPQFEVGRDRLGPGGVVRDPALRESAVLGVAQAATSLGLIVRAAVASPLPGPGGNVEYFLWMTAPAGAAPHAPVGPTGQDVPRAVPAGPAGAVPAGPAGAVPAGPAGTVPAGPAGTVPAALAGMVRDAVERGPTGEGSTWTSGGGR